MDSFEEKHRLLTDDELFGIINNEVEYYQEAVESAKSELKFRNYTDDDLSDSVRQYKASLQRVKINKILGSQDRYNKIFSFIDIFFDRNVSVKLIDRIIWGICLFFAFIATINLYKLCEYLYFCLSYNNTDGILIMSIPFIMITYGLIKFYNKYKSGWILLSLYSAFSAISAINLAVKAIFAKPIGIPVFDDMISTSQIIIYVFSIICYSAVLRYICIKSIRDIYGVTKQVAIITFAAAVVFSLIMSTEILFY